MPGTPDDRDLLDLYANAGDDAAFRELGRRYLNLVYSAASRRVGDAHLAEDVTQAVFMILAQKPKAAHRAVPLSRWLLTTVRYAAANALKIERRRRRHEAAAAASRAAGACSPNPSDVLVWQEVASELDDALLKLPAADRTAVLLRHFEQRPISEIAQVLKTSEAAAGMRLSRAVEKLRKRLNREGAGFAPAGAASLDVLLGSHAVCAAPPGLFASVSGVAGGAAAGSAASLTIAKGAVVMMTFTKLKAFAVVVAILMLVGTGAVVTLNNARAGSASAGAPNANLRQKAEARVQAAERLLALLEQRLRVSEPMTPAFIELQTTAHRRLAEARIDTARDAAARLRAAEQYVQQARDMVTLLEARKDQDVTAIGAAQGAYGLADAEYLLATLQGK